MWAEGCSFRLRVDGSLTIADGGAMEEHDLAMESLRHGWRYLPHLRHFWRQINPKLRLDSFPAPKTDACPAPTMARLESALQEFGRMMPGRPVPKVTCPRPPRPAPM